MLMLVLVSVERVTCCGMYVVRRMHFPVAMMERWRLAWRVGRFSVCGVHRLYAVGHESACG